MAEETHAVGYRRFRKAMQEGKLRPGMIVTQNELCKLLGVSLTPLRETLVLLEEFGLVEVKRRAGIRVVYPEVAFIRENFQFRSLIELHAIRMFADLVKPEWLARMREKHEAVLAALAAGDPGRDGVDAFARLDPEMHLAFVGALENNAIAVAYNRIMDNINLARQVHERTLLNKRVADSAEEHLAILRSLEEGDSEGAVANLEAHFRASTYRTIVAA